MRTFCSRNRPWTVSKAHPASSIICQRLGKVDLNGMDSISLWARTETKNRINSHPIIHCPTSEGVSEVSAAERTSEAISAEQANE